jgi:uncharacterized protein YjiS (DUF1127 family)
VRQLHRRGAGHSGGAPARIEEERMFTLGMAREHLSFRRPGASAALARPRAAVGRLAARVLRRRRLRRDARELRAFEDRLLHDIGLDRDAVERVVWTGRDRA